MAERKSVPGGARAGRWASDLATLVWGLVDTADAESATRRVQALRSRHPEWDSRQTVDALIKHKARQTAIIGAATTGGSLIPGLGTLASWTVGMAADFSATLLLQAELVLEIADVHGQSLSAEERRRVVALVMGISAAENQLIAQGIRRSSLQLGERFASRWLARGIPFVGVATSASANALGTYVIGQRADAYFSLGPAAMGDVREALRAITGVDERRVGDWLAGGVSTSRRLLAGGARRTTALTRRATDATGSAARRTADSIGGAAARLRPGRLRRPPPTATETPTLDVPGGDAPDEIEIEIADDG